MKRIITSLLAALMLAVSSTASAGSYYGYVRNWGPEANGDVIFDVLSNSNISTTTTAHYVAGQCGAGAYRLKIGQANYNETYTSLLMAAKNNYLVLFNVTSCAGTINIIDTVKVCSWTGNC